MSLFVLKQILLSFDLDLDSLRKPFAIQSNHQERVGKQTVVQFGLTNVSEAGVGHPSWWDNVSVSSLWSSPKDSCPPETPSIAQTADDRGAITLLDPEWARGVVKVIQSIFIIICNEMDHCLANRITVVHALDLHLQFDGG